MSDTAARTAQTRSDDDPGAADSGASGSDLKEIYRRAWQSMIRARLMEEKLSNLYRAGKIVGGVYVGRGQEAFSAALTAHLDSGVGDVYAPLIRDQAGRLAFGEPLLDGPRTYFGSVKGPTRGRDGNMHRGRPAQGLLAPISHLGSSISVVVGMLMAKRFHGKTGMVGAASIGEGATSTGACHEALNLAGVEKVPIVVSVANNRYAYSTSNDRQFACENLVDRAIGYGFTGHTVDGTDLEACLEVFQKAVGAARAGDGPQMVVGSLLRLSGHGEHDDASYISEEDRAAPYGRDCLEVARAQIVELGFADDAECTAWDAEAVAEVEQAVATAQKEPGPDPYAESWGTLASKHLNEGYFEE